MGFWLLFLSVLSSVLSRKNGQCILFLSFHPHPFIPIFYLLSILFFGNLYRSFLFPYAIGLLFVFFSFLPRYFYSLVSLGEFRSPKRYPFFPVIYLVLFSVRRLASPLAHFLSALFLVFCVLFIFYASVLLYIELFYLFI